MLEQTTRREAGTTWVGAAYENDRSRLGLALVLLLVALAVLVVKDRDFWFGDAENSVADQTSPEWIPGSVILTPATPASKEKVHVAPVRNSTEPVVAARTTRPADHTVKAPT